MTTYYLDSSVAMRILLGHSPAAAHWFDDTTASNDEILSSRLLGTEMTRVLRRLEAPIERRHEVLSHVGTIALDHAVLQEAEAILPHIKTLDAIHLASALRSGRDGVIICTHDRTMQAVSHDLGLATMDPVTDDPGNALV
ncbi:MULTISPECIES: PIN domain-containing protein [unclassified Luteococcus]|uniref:PIN domain-containing protein n=1 Tax=unclassified Luteococcus TaxID=2639923 RepID=UPI00313CBDCA